jgi:hypothetical protein
MKMNQLGMIFVVMLLTGGVAYAAEPLGLQWDPNSELDLAGYFVYEAEIADGQVIGTYMVSVPAPLTEFLFVDSHVDGQYYWKITAYDTAGNESGFSSEVTADFNVVPPVPPTGCSVMY